MPTTHKRYPDNGQRIKNLVLDAPCPLCNNRCKTNKMGEVYCTKCSYDVCNELLHNKIKGAVDNAYTSGYNNAVDFVKKNYELVALDIK